MIRIGILSPSSIALNRFLPSLIKTEQFQYIGIAAASPEEWTGEATEELLIKEREKADSFQKKFGGKIFSGYRSLLESEEIDAVYLPLPPALHCEWGIRTLEHGKHLLVEKPSTTNVRDTKRLVKTASNDGLALHENYMFQYHTQLEEIQKKIASGELGEIRTYKLSFGFPHRGMDDFRYSKAMGGGALLDCGGYPVKLASLLLGDTARVVQSRLNDAPGCEVDLFGTAVLENAEGICAQISFGMDNAYQCQLEVWGSRQTLIAPRIFTAGAGVKPTLILRSSSEERVLELEEDDQFRKSIEAFGECISNPVLREESCRRIQKQADLIDQIGGANLCK